MASRSIQRLLMVRHCFRGCDGGCSVLFLVQTAAWRVDEWCRCTDWQTCQAQLQVAVADSTWVKW